MANPELIEVTRGKLVESRHRGAIAVMSGDGRAVLRLGDTQGPVYPRSAVKVMQAIPLLTSGAAEAYGFGDQELALACSSHNGEPRHVDLVASMLERMGLDQSALECGTHQPFLERAARNLMLSAGKPSPLHNNCSGKHAGMLAVARYLKEPHEGYVQPDHAVQRRIARILAELTGALVSGETCGTDGCSVPTWGVPLEALALGFARLAAGQGASAEHLVAGKRLMEACMAEPGMVAGEKRFCTEVMEALGPVVFVKTGAEGVFCAAVPEFGLGIALKIDDGTSRASEAATANVLSALLPAHAGVLARWTRRPVRGVAGAEVGEIRQSTGLLKSLAAMPRHSRAP